MRTFLLYKIGSFAGRLVALVVVCVCWLPSQGQQTAPPTSTSAKASSDKSLRTKNPLQLADQYFAAGEYYTAAYIYEQYLNPSKSNTKTDVFPVYARKKKAEIETNNRFREAVLYKQAESYRLANYWLNADSGYKQCPGYIDALYWSAVCERSLGKYDEAEEHLRNYLNATGTTRQFEEAAIKELNTLQFIRSQLAREDSVLVHIGKLQTPDSYEKGAFGFAFAGGDKYFISSTRTDSATAKGMNPNNSHLFYATLNNDSLTQLTPVAYPAPATPVNQGAASLSADGNRMYFTQWKKENGHIASNIFYMVKQSDGAWSAPLVLEQVNTAGTNSKQPFCTANGKYLFFASDRAGGYGGFDIWYAPVNTDGSIGEPVNAGATINTSGDEQAPFYHAGSGTLVFATNGRQGMGGYDLFSSKGNETNWSMPGNMGHPVNSSRDDIYFFAPEKSALLANAVVGSDRGAGCCMENYHITKAPKNKRLRGLVVNCKNNTPISGAAVVLTDSLGNTRKTITDTEGKYVFEIDNDNNFTLTIKDSAYHDTTAVAKIIKADETNLLTDQLFNAELCIEKKFVLKAENVVTVFFDFDKSNLKPEAVNKLDSLYNILVQIPGATLQISGYTDGKGSVEYNKKLSDRRARACADYFVQKGLDASRITFESFGSCCPLEMELINGRDNPDGRSRNRRALINVSKE